MHRANTVGSTVLNYTASSGSRRPWDDMRPRTEENSEGPHLWQSLYRLERTMTQAVSRWPLIPETRVQFQDGPLGIVVDKVPLWPVFLPVGLIQRSPVSIIPPMLHTRPFIYHWCYIDLATNSFLNPYPTAFPYGNGMVLHFYQQQESSTTKTVHRVINKGLKTYV